ADPAVVGGDTGDHRHATAVDDLERQLHSGRQADRLDAVVGAVAAADRPDARGDVGIGGVRLVGGSEIPGGVALVGQGVDRDDPGRPGQLRRLDRVETHAAAADDDHRRPGVDPGAVDDRPDAGGHTAADQADHLQRCVLSDGYQALLREHGALGVG